MEIVSVKIVYTRSLKKSTDPLPLITSNHTQIARFIGSSFCERRIANDIIYLHSTRQSQTDILGIPHLQQYLQHMRHCILSVTTTECHHKTVIMADELRSVRQFRPQWQFDNSNYHSVYFSYFILQLLKLQLSVRKHTYRPICKGLLG